MTIAQTRTEPRAEMQDADQTSEQAQVLAKRERVRRYLIEPLERDGMIRDRRTSAADHAAFLDWMQDRLGYLTDDNLGRLRQVCVALAGGQARNVWPSKVTIRNHAYKFQTPPDDANPIMQTWLHSRRGPALRDQGQLVETYEFLRVQMRPPSDYDERQIAELARENARKRARVVEAIALGRASEDDRRWLAWYDHLAALCDDIVDAGIAHRRALASSGDAA